MRSTNNENAIEFYSGDEMCTVSLTNKRHCNKIRKLHMEHSDEFGHFIENVDGSVYARIPLRWLKISYPRNRAISDDEKAALIERFAKAREAKMRKGESNCEV